MQPVVSGPSRVVPSNQQYFGDSVESCVQQFAGGFDVGVSSSSFWKILFDFLLGFCIYLTKFKAHKIPKQEFMQDNFSFIIIICEDKLAFDLRECVLTLLLI